MHNVSSSLCSRSALVYNRQPDISRISQGVDHIVQPADREINVCYALPHRHYALASNEVIIATKTDRGHRTSVHFLAGQEDLSPCMWYPDRGEYVPVMFTSSRLQHEMVFPQTFRDDCGIIHPDFAYEWVELTDHKEREQVFLTDVPVDPEDAIVTVIKVFEIGQCIGSCASYCRTSGDGHEQCHKTEMLRHG